MPIARGLSRAKRSWASFRQTPNSRATIPTCRTGTPLSADEKKLYARMMEVFAGFLTHTDYHYRPPVQFPEDDRRVGEHADHVHLRQRRQLRRRPDRIGQREQVLQQRAGLAGREPANIDELGRAGDFNHYAWGWTFAGNTPFRRWKRETYRGGISDPFIVHWPKGIKAKGEVRTQYAHAIDMVPTVLEALGIEAPASIKGVTQSPIEGLSFAHALDDAKAPTKHITQYFEMMGHRSIYHDGWRAVCPWPGPSFKEAGLFFGAPIDKDKLTELDAKGWELYHIEKDFAENHNIAAENRAKLIEMIATWYVEAGKYNVLPVDSRGTLRFADERPQIAVARTCYIFYPGTQVVPVNATANVLNRPHSITADVEIPKGGAEGVLLSQGGDEGGYSFYVQDGKLRYVYNYVGRNSITSSHEAVPRRASRAALRVRGDRQARHRARQGRAGQRPALHRRQAGRAGRHSPDHAARHRIAGRDRVRRGRGLAGDAEVQAAVHIHRHDLQSNRGRERRVDQGRRGRTAQAPSAAVEVVSVEGRVWSVTET